MIPKQTLCEHCSILLLLSLLVLVHTARSITSAKFKRDTSFDDQETDNSLIRVATIKSSGAKLDCSQQCAKDEACSR